MAAAASSHCINELSIKNQFLKVGNTQYPIYNQEHNIDEWIFIHTMLYILFTTNNKNNSGKRAII